MISKKTSLRLLGLPVLMGMAATPLYASTGGPEDATTTDPTAPLVEIIYPEFAQVGGDDIGGGSNSNSSGNDNRRVAPSGPPVAATTPQTTQIVNQLGQIQRICEFMGDEYKIACFATTYRDLAEEMPANGDYAEAREVLLDTARKLDTLYRRNLDRQKPALTARIRTDNGRTKPTPPMRAVRADRAPQLNQQAANIVAEAETVLLRSASSDASRAIHYQRIAAAVGSNKVLLRSS